MKTYRLHDMVGGWFVGDFTPTALGSAGCEVAYKRYRAGIGEVAHVHRIATEVTAIISGRVRMNAVDYEAGTIVVIGPGEATDFRALEDTVTVVVKIPSLRHDKYPV